MHIQSVDLYRFSIPMEPFAIATGTMTKAQNMLVRIRTEEGVEGWGECSAFPYITGETQDTCLVMGKLFASFLLEQNAREVSLLSDSLRRVAAGNFTAKSAFDMAMYDAAAREAHMPVYQWLGGKKKNFVTDITVGIGPAADMAAQAAAYVRKGASVLKIKIGKDAREDIKRMLAIRDAAGEEVTIRADANQGYTPEQAMIAFEGMEPARLEFCEQPMPRQTGDLALEKLHRHSNVPVMLDESVSHSADLLTILPFRPFFHSINIKFAKCGGFTEAIRMASLAAKNEIPCMIGGMLESRLGMTAFAHFAAATPQVRYFDMDTALLGHLADPVVGGAEYGPGFSISISDEPGLGCSIDADFLKSCEHWHFSRKK